MRSLVLNITNGCNFKCKTCLREYGRSENVSFDLLKSVIVEAKKFGLSRVGITGGEPCLHPEFENIIDFLDKNQIDFRFLSNGSLLDKYKFLVEKGYNNLTECVFSLDGATKEVHDSIRQSGSFEKVKESIDYFVSNGVPVVLQTCINKLNEHQIEGIIKLASSCGVKSINIIGMIQTAHNKDIFLNDAEKAKVLMKINELRKKYPIMIRPGASLGLYSGVNFCGNLTFFRDISINPKGQLVFCCDTIRDGAVIGSLYEKSLAELYTKALDWSAYLKKIRIEALKNNKLFEGFNTCEFCNKYLSERIE